MISLTRRGFLAGAGVAAAMVTPGLLATRAVAQGSDITTLRDRWRDMLTGANLVQPDEPVFAQAIANLDQGVAGYRDLLTLSSTQVFSDLDIQSDDPGALWKTYTRLKGMASAWYTPGSQFHGDGRVIEEVLEGLRVNNAVAYYEGRERTGNWWQWLIGAPRDLADAMTIVDEHLTADERDRYSAAMHWFLPDPFYGDDPSELSTGGNRADQSAVAVVHGIVTGDGERITRGRDGLHDTYQYVTVGAGFRSDGSFLQHTDGGGGIPYNGGYGLALLAGVSRMTGLLAGSSWEITDPTVQNLFDMVDLAYAPLIHDGRMMDCVSGRYIARPPTRDHIQGHGAITAILGLVRAVDADTQARWRAMCRGWLERDTFHPPYQDLAVAPTALVHELLTDAEVKPSAEPDGHFSYNNMDRVVHRRRGWAVAIAMFSRWVKAMEANSGENRKGTYISSGMTYLYDSDGAQYSDDFWPTVDPYRLPGTTLDTTPPSEVGWSVSTAVWAGGAALDGYGAVGQDIQERFNPLAARKSWFCFDEYIAALGTVIESPTGNAVETIIENRHLHLDGTNELRVDGPVQSGDQGWTDRFAAARWAHLDGVAGYVFPMPLTLNAQRYERTGSWRDINSNGDPTPITRRYLSLWVDHGANPENSRYSYLLVPGASADRTAQLADDPGIEILADTKELHAVRQLPAGITAANFWSPGTVAGITVESPAETDVPTMVVDDLDSEFEIVSGTWQTETGDGQWKGHQHHHEPGDGSALARFHASVPVSGRYAVDAWWVASQRWATDAPYVVHHDGGEAEVRVGQRNLSSRWVPLGAFDFTAGQDYAVDVHNGANAVVVADAIRFAPMPHRGGCSVILQERRRELRVAVSDPTHMQARLQLTLEPDGRYRDWTADDTVEVTDMEGRIKITVDTSEGDARSHRVTFRR